MRWSRGGRGDVRCEVEQGWGGRGRGRGDVWCEVEQG